MRLFELGPQTLDSGGYLAHLGIELTLKAFLLHSTGEFPDEHNLERLYELVTGAGVSFPSESFLGMLRQVNSFWELRYPNPAGSPPIGSLDWGAVHHLFGTVRERLPAELNRAIDQIDHTRKGGRILLDRPPQWTTSGWRRMSTLRAIAFILNGALIAVALFLLNEERVDDVQDLLIFALLLAAPSASIITIALAGRTNTPGA